MIDPREPDFRNTPASPQRPEFGYRLADADAPPVITIVTPYWNNARELFHETAQSVFRQSIQQWEWLIVNDRASDAQALAVLDEYRNRDPRIRVIDNAENLGLAGSRNVGFAQARAEFVFLLDDDDLMEPTALEKFYWFLIAHPEFAVVNGRSIGFGAKDYLWPHGFERGAQLLDSNSATGRAMVRRSAHEQVGGYDATIRAGMEDWEYWIRLADKGMWGFTIEEYLDWYRRRDDHGDRWADLDGGARFEAFRKMLQQRYARLYAGAFPEIQPRRPLALDTARTDAPAINRLTKRGRRLLMILPWLQIGGADKFNLDLVEQLRRRGWEVTIATTLAGDHGWEADFARHTPDIFALSRFLPLDHYPAFLRYLVESRASDVVLVSNSEFGYWLLPWLRHVCPAPAYVDFTHSEQDFWKNGGYPRYSAGAQDALELNICGSAHLKNWMTQRGAEPQRVEIAYINVDSDLWQPSASGRARVRRELKIGSEQGVVMFAGRIGADKQPHVLCPVLIELMRRVPGAAAIVIGDGPDGAWMRDEVAAAGLGDRIHMVGAVTSERVRELLAAGDVFFLPSRWEGIALSIYEAMSMGLAIVAAAVGGQCELVTPECGLMLPRADAPMEIERYLEALTGLLDDPKRMRAMGAAGRARIEGGFRLHDMGERMTALFERAIAMRDGDARTRLGPRTAQELATRAVEYLRMTAVLDEGWIASQYQTRNTVELRQLYEDALKEARRLGDGWTKQQSRIQELDREKDSLWAEARRLARGWETQTARIAELETALRDVWSDLEQTVVQRDALQRHIVFRLLRRVGLTPSLPQETHRT